MKKPIFALTSIGLALAACLSTPAIARWAEVSEADAAVNFRNTSYEIRADGTYTYVFEQQVEILKESARDRNGLTRITYDSHAASFEVLEAKTINPDGVFPVDREHIEIKPLASQGPGFDQKSLVTIGFPEVNVGSKLYLKYRQTQKEASIPGFFSDVREFGFNEYIQKASAHFKSAVPLYFEVNDPDHALTVPARAGGATQLDFELKSPVFRAVYEEKDSRLDPRSLLWLSVSSVRDWRDFPRETPEAYEKAINSPLPDKFVKIFAEALRYDSDVDQINSVTSQLEDAVRYLGDWIPIQGAFHPRTLETIATTGYGDCKDFSVSAGAILRRLGYNVHSAWIIRGENAIIPPGELPASSFNHAILHLEKDGKEYWLDPTNVTSYAQGLYPDIADRPALVLDPRAVVLKHTPPLLASQSGMLLDFKFRFDDGSLIRETGVYALTGRETIWMAGKSLSNSKTHIDYDLVHWLSNGRQLMSWKLGAYDFSSRDVKDVTLPVEFTERWLPTLTSAGRGYEIFSHNLARVFNFVAAGRVSDLNIGHPETARRQLRFVGRKVILPKKIACSAHSEWVDFSRRLRREGRDVVFTEDVTTKKQTIPIAAIHSPSFEDLQKSVADCLQEVVVVFQ
jgi:hypothetical protein